MSRKKKANAETERTRLVGELAQGEIAQRNHMPTLERAIEIAAQAHGEKKQLDKAGQPYILHPLRVMLAVKRPHERMAAVLHDVVEDTEVTIEDLRSEGFPTEVLDAVLALTKTGKKESRIHAASRAAANPIARVVKLADVADNMDISRLSQLTEKDRVRLNEYKEVQAFLLSKGVA